MRVGAYEELAFVIKAKLGRENEEEKGEGIIEEKGKEEMIKGAKEERAEVCRNLYTKKQKGKKMRRKKR